MTEYISTNIKVWWQAVVFWVVVFLASAVFVNPNSGEVVINNYLFHFIMFVFATLLLYFIFRYYTKIGLFELKTFYTFILVNVVLDLIVLVGFSLVSITEWLTLIFPAYILGSLVVWKLLK
jgi:hypothetical protein